MINFNDEFYEFLETFIEKIEQGQYFYIITLKQTHKKISAGSLEYIIWVDKKRDEFNRLKKLQQILDIS